MKTINKTKTITLFNSWNTDYSDYLECYKENIETDLTDEDIENSESFLNYVSDCESSYYEDLLNNCLGIKHFNDYCLITGELGLWNGQPSIEPVLCDDLKEAIQKCSESMDYLIIELIDGVVKVQGIHHDGRNIFYIQPLNSKGVKHVSDNYYPNLNMLANGKYFKKYSI